MGASAPFNMLQSTPLSKVYGHGHIKKFWLMQNQKETENKTLVASSTSRNTGNSTGLGHESKQGSQFSVGNTSTRTLSSPSGLPARPLVSGPACFNMARHTSLATCAESLSPPSRMEQSRSSVRPPSPNMSTVSVKEEKHYSAADDDWKPSKSPCREDANSASTPQWGSSLGFQNQLAGDFRCPLSPKEESYDNVNDGFSPSKDPRLNSFSSQDGYEKVMASNDATRQKRSSGPSKCSLGFFSELETVTPFAVPFQLPEKFFLEAEAKAADREASSKVGSHIALSGKVGPVKSAMPLILNCELGRRELYGGIEGEIRKDDGLCSPVLRTCSVCGTSKTPLWRSGPQGPKSLCNACGIRFKKARRGSGDGSECPAPSLASPLGKTSLKAAKRKQDGPLVNADTLVSKPLVMNGLTTQVVKKRKWLKKGEGTTQNGEATGSSNESSSTWNLHSPSAVSSPSVSHFERLSINESSTGLDMVGKDEEEAAVLLMYMSWGLVFA